MEIFKEVSGLNPFLNRDAYMVTIDVPENRVFTIPSRKFDMASINYRVDYRGLEDGEVGSKECKKGECGLTFKTGGLKQLSISGGFQCIMPFGGALVSVDQWGSTPWKTLASAFLGCDNLESVPGVPPNLGECRSMKNMFRAAKKFDCSLEEWDVSNVVDMCYMFDGASSFNGDLKNWDVSNVRYMDYMFYDAKRFNGDLNQWTPKNGTGVLLMFDGSGLEGNPPEWYDFSTCS